MTNDTADPPAEFLCPITLQIMNIPVMDRVSGHTFERATILEWIQRGRGTNPLTRGPLSARNLVPNESLQQEISQWKMANNCLEEEEEEEESKGIPFYRRKNSERNSLLDTTSPSITAGNDFLQRLREAQRKDEEFRNRIQMLFATRR